MDRLLQSDQWTRGKTKNGGILLPIAEIAHAIVTKVPRSDETILN